MEKTTLKALNDATVTLTDNNFKAVEFSGFLADAIAQLSECYLLASESEDLGCTAKDIQKTIYFLNVIRNNINRAEDLEEFADGGR